MLAFIARRIGVILLTMVCLTLIVFAFVNLEPRLKTLALEQSNNRMSDREVASWLDENGYTRPFVVRYGEWVANAATGDLGRSTRFRKPVAEVIGERLWYTAILMFWVMVVMIPSALLLGVLAGMREGSKQDRSLSVVSIISTSTPEYVSGILFTVIFASAITWNGKPLFKGVAKAGDIDFWNFTLPVLTIAIYGMGYIARMTRASMAEVMNQQYIRTARLKGLSLSSIVMKHALRNALIAPFTVIMLQFPWLLTGVVIVEAIFNYKGFGWTLIQAADNNDINLLLACSLVSVVIVLATQLISDIGYVFLNPRIRVQ